MIALGNANRLRSLHVNSFAAVTGTFTKSGNEMTCTVDGAAYMPFKFAYGTWEFDIYKDGENNIIGIRFVLGLNEIPLKNTYYINIYNTELIEFYVRDTSTSTKLFTTTTSYISNKTLYRIRITRSLANVFTFYIKGGAFADWTLISVSGGSGTNPVTDSSFTTSNFFRVDLNVGDKIGNITWKPYI